MSITICKGKDYKDISRRAANILSAQVIMKPDCVLGLATGSTPVATYQQLVEWYQKGDIDFSSVTTVNLDEYKGLSPDSDQSYRYFMNMNFFDHINIDKNHTFVPDGTQEDAQKACADYDNIIEATGGIDLQLLGLGHNGHIGFNEPSDHFEMKTHCVTLAQSTIDANRKFFDRIEDVPRFAYTVGMGSIMHARKILLLVSGEEKADIVKKAFFESIRPEVPASILQLHRDVIVIGDEAALSKIDI